MTSELGDYINSVRQCFTFLYAGANREITVAAFVIAHIDCCEAEVRGPAAGHEQLKANTQIR